MEWILYTALIALLAYGVIRLAVFHGVRDADRAWMRSFESARRDSDEMQ